jgi:hypothetical protein
MAHLGALWWRTLVAINQSPANHLKPMKMAVTLRFSHLEAFFHR